MSLGARIRPRGSARGAVVLVCLAATGCALRVAPAGTMRHVAGSTPSASLDPAQIRVLVWNVFKASRPGWWMDFQALVPRHDVFLLQEGWWSPKSERRLARLGGDWWMGVTFFSLWSDGAPATGTVVGGRAPLHDVRSRHSRYREPLTATPKSHCLGYFALEGRDETLLVVSVHGINFRLELTPFVDQLRMLLDDVRDHAGPTLVAGDFNTWSDERLASLFAAMTHEGLTSVYPRVGDDGRTTSSGHYLDHAFVEGLEVVGEARVLTAIDSSDHQALSFSVRVPPDDVTAAAPASSPPP